MKEKIVAKFKAKFPAVTLSTKRMDEIADRLSKKVTNEDEIDTKLDEMNELLPFADIQKSDDQIRDLKSKVKTATTKQDTTENSNQSGSTTTKTGEETQTSDDTPAWAKSLIESNQQLSQKLAAMEKEKVQQTIQQKVSGHEKLKGIPTVFFKGRSLPEKEEDLETFVDGIKADYDTFKQETNNEGLLNGHKPGGGTGGGSNQKTSDMFNQVMAQKKSEATAINGANQNK